MKQKLFQGLTDAQVLESRRLYGDNVLTPAEQVPVWKQFLIKFKDPLIIILIFAGVLSVGISCYEYWGLGETAVVFFEPAGIFVAILLATGLAFYFEHNADKEFAILNQVNDDELIDVIRNGKSTAVPRRDIVVGDVVILNTGAEIPADGELLKAVHMQVDESSLTGEPSADKYVEDADSPEAKLNNSSDSETTYAPWQVMRGTKVMEGHGVMRVLAVGDATESGKLMEAAQIDNSVKTPLNEQLDKLGKWISYASYTVGVGIVLGRILTFMLTYDFELVHFITYMLQTFMIAVTLVVVAVPEGLPMAITLSLAYSMRSMLKSNNLVRKMHACETMGATTVICTDKTGTLTQNKMRVEDYVIIGDEAESEALRDLFCENIALNSTAELDLTGEEPSVLGNPTEGALLLWLRAQGGDYLGYRNNATILEELEFTTERKYMASTVMSAVTGKKIRYVKGAPEIVGKLCGVVENGEWKSASIGIKLGEWQDKAMRTLGFAYQIEDGPLTFMAIVAIADPVRANVPDAIRESMAAGIGVKIVTGDTARIAQEIGRQIGLIGADEKGTIDAKSIITGPEFEALSDEELLTRVKDLKIIARARPMDKKRLVEALQTLGEVVAVTGDGTNDAPALNAAHVGLSMGDGTAVAKGASDITIIDNSFASINQAVMWGRSLYQNIQRFLLFQLTVNVSACLIVLAGAFMGTESPLTVTQMLWVNLIMDTFGAMALASLPPSRSVMGAKPRDRKAFILTKDMMWNVGGVGVAFFVMLFVLLWIFQHADINSMTQLWEFIKQVASGRWQVAEVGEVTPYEQTLLFSIFVWTHFWYMFNARAFYTKRSIFGSKLSTGFLTIVTVIILGQLFIVEIAYDFFNVAPMLHDVPRLGSHPEGLKDLLIIIGGSAIVLVIRELWNGIKKLTN